MIASIIYALTGLRGVLRITHATPDGSRTMIEYTSTDALLAMSEFARTSSSYPPALWGGESPTRKYMLISTPEQVLERRRKLEYEAECENARIREYGCSWAGN